MPALHRACSPKAHSILSGHPSVGGLLCASGPANVARFVVAVVIDTLQRHVSRRAEPHICDERLEAIGPPSADGDSSSAVVDVGLVLRVRASLFHHPPHLMFGLTAHAMSAMRRLASAGRGRTNTKATDKDLALCSTHAATQKVSHRPVTPRGFCDDGPMLHDCAWSDRTD